jgi:hypothetical protein
LKGMNRWLSYDQTPITIYLIRIGFVPIANTTFGSHQLRLFETLSIRLLSGSPQRKTWNTEVEKQNRLRSLLSDEIALVQIHKSLFL